ncbi:phosphotransferase [Streptomyces sp. UNOB3_S3]|uniref:phosphotransferase n=1 Tax=Streptomyces sp. UNOB3_S3 TaxID=2871682 RepID=UPI001E64B1F5|nr:phosphotransferase [Streptomyces sp. UNOB3_S3]MCC3774586.1 aminoglycoside phosphotransferase family protein [Streptomyces sp. UNOB3_S3]
MTNLSDRAERAMAIATRAGRRLGLRADEPRVLHDVFNVLVHLAPEPVVVRVPSLGFAGAEELERKQRRELAVTGWLADTGAPVVRPSPLVPREPVVTGGTSLTFWEFVSEEKPAADEDLLQRFVEQTGNAAELHALLAGYPGELPVLSPLVPGLRPLLDKLAERRPDGLTTADLDRAEAEYAALEALVADLPAHFPGSRLQPLHGDSPAYNMLRVTGGRRLFSDFEDVTLGPVEWDLTLVGPQGIEAYERAGGGPVDPALLEAMEGARLLQVVGALAFVPLMPEMGAMLEPAVARWRERAPLSVSR